MATQKCGKQSFLLSNPPAINHWASVAGKKESEGPLGKYFDVIKKRCLLRRENLGTRRKETSTIGTTDVGIKSEIAII